MHLFELLELVIAHSNRQRLTGVQRNVHAWTRVVHRVHAEGRAGRSILDCTSRHFSATTKALNGWSVCTIAPQQAIGSVDGKWWTPPRDCLPFSICHAVGGCSTEGFLDEIFANDA